MQQVTKGGRNRNRERDRGSRIRRDGTWALRHRVRQCFVIHCLMRRGAPAPRCPSARVILKDLLSDALDDLGFGEDCEFETVGSVIDVQYITRLEFTRKQPYG